MVTQLTVVAAMPGATSKDEHEQEHVRNKADHEEVDVQVIILLHGVGESGKNWTNFLSKIAPPNTRFILPTAPKAPVNMFGLIEMNSW